MMRILFLLIVLAVSTMAQDAPKDLPKEWIDPDTGHRVVRLTDEPGSQSLYFHQNPYTATGDKMVFTSPTGLYAYDFKSGKSQLLVEGRVGSLVVGPKTRHAYYFKGDSVYATSLDTGATRLIIKRGELRTGAGFGINADETLLGGSYVEGGRQFVNPSPPAPGQPSDSYAGKENMMRQRLAAKLPMALYTINIKSGEVKEFYQATDWLNHVQFSPTDPELMMFCHEGPWHLIDRIWTIRIDGSNKRLMHKRTMDMEIAGHEFFGPGNMLWYDLQTPKSQVFWLAGVDVVTDKRIRYKVAREEWSVHFNVSPDGKLFAGDGGGPNSVAAPGNGQWIYLFVPDGDRLKTTRLVSLARHNYGLEPNVTFTPDQKWIVFRSNMLGPTFVFAVEVEPQKDTKSRKRF
ncbi:MAG TPA: oligogalacturonate lyase family protein [Pyrinomonadaceae bacterium]|nr:oligogalacturonate lyase family protein [Pyrinomonadaceae bacterium]